MSDWIAILVSFIYVFAALGVAEGLRKVGHYTLNFTRKFVHIAVGMWAFGTVSLFHNRWMAVIPPTVFILLNYLSYRQGIFNAIESKNRSNLGTVYFPIAFSLIILLLWEDPNLLVASLMPLTWGDAMAAILGKAYGQIEYTIFNQVRSVEGSVSMFLFSLISTVGALWLLPPNIAGWQNLGLAFTTALAATLTEAISPWGLDNLTIPAVSSLILYFLLVG